MYVVATKFVIHIHYTNSHTVRHDGERTHVLDAHDDKPLQQEPFHLYSDLNLVLDLKACPARN